MLKMCHDWAMKLFAAYVLALMIGAGVAALAHATAHADPTLDQRCINPAYVHMHEVECRDATNPADYN